MELTDLYQEVIIDHNREPRHFHEMNLATHHAEGFNPLCGDKLHLYLKIEDNKIIDASFQGSGCAISTASASLMTDTLIGLHIEEAETLFKKFHEAIVEENASDEALGKLSVLLGVKAYPARVKCATLAWHTLQSALNGDQSITCTE